MKQVKDDGFSPNQANYCSFYHLHFWGRQFAPELTHCKNGFIMRTKFKADLDHMEKELRLLFKGCHLENPDESIIKLELKSRNTPY